MKAMKMIMVLLGLIIVFALFLVVKTVTHKFGKAENVANVEVVEAVPTEKAIKRFAGGIRIPTISTTVYEETNFKPFDEFRAYLAEAYPEVYKTMETTTVNTHSMLFRWKGKNSELKPLLFLSHYDVVPVVGHDPATMETPEYVFNFEDMPAAPLETISSDWEYDPFSGAVANGRIYGRGTLDMKCMLFSLMEGADELIAEGYQPERDIWFAFGHDEEVSGRQGAVKIAEYFKEKGLSFEAVYDEGGIIAAPGSVMESVKAPMALVGIGEKGFLTLRLKVHGVGGHSSMPPAQSSLVYAAEIMTKLNENQMPAEIIPPIASFLDNVGGEMGFASRMAIANQWLLKPLLLKSLSKSPSSNALTRTTTAITMAKGSDAPNVMASVAEVTVNFRILPGNTVQDVIDHVKRVCEGYEVDFEVISDREPSSLSPTNVRGFEIIQEKIGQLYPDAIVSAYVTIGGTDAYKYQVVSDHIYRLMPISLNLYEQRSIHNENEHITLDNYGKMIWYFKEIMRTY